MRSELSSDVDATSSRDGSGDQETKLAQSEWPVSVLSKLPVETSQIRISFANAPAANLSLSGDQLTVQTETVSLICRSSSPESARQIRIVPSKEADARRVQSGDHAT